MRCLVIYACLILAGMSDKIRAAALQMVSSPDVNANLDTVNSLMKQAAEVKARLIVLPEYFPILSEDEQEKLNHREEYGSGPLQEFLADHAQRLGAWIVGGSIPLATEDPERVTNSSLLFNPEGLCVARYDKMHLFDVFVDGRNESYNESKTMVAGEKVIVADTAIGKIGLSICYDLRFPELYRSMLDKGVNIITVPSAFTETTGRKHWELLVRARAVENLCYVVATNQGGQHTEKRKTWGHSMIVDPWGEILCSMETGVGMIYADLDLEQQESLRNSFPALQHRHL